MKGRFFTPPRLARITLLFGALLVASQHAARAQSQAPAQDVPPHYALVVNAAERYGIDVPVFVSLVYQESTFRPDAVSKKNGANCAYGLTQLTPATAARFGVRNILEPAENVEGGAKYMRWLLDYFGGNYALALAGYNAGEGAVVKYGYRIPPYSETVNYVTSVLRRAALYRGGQVPRAAALRLTAKATPRARATRIGDAAKADDDDDAETESLYFWP